MAGAGVISKELISLDFWVAWPRRFYNIRTYDEEEGDEREDDHEQFHSFNDVIEEEEEGENDDEGEEEQGQVKPGDGNQASLIGGSRPATGTAPSSSIFRATNLNGLASSPNQSNFHQPANVTHTPRQKSPPTNTENNASKVNTDFILMKKLIYSETNLLL